MKKLVCDMPERAHDTDAGLDLRSPYAAAALEVMK